MASLEQSYKKIQRKMVKKIMDEPSSVSSCSEWSQRKETDFGSSLHLEQIDSNRSSVVLRDICDKITYGLHDVKPLYVYQGSYPDEVTKFKDFIFKSKTNKHKIKDNYPRSVLNNLKSRKLILPLRKLANNHNELPIKLSVANSRPLKRVEKA